MFSNALVSRATRGGRIFTLVVTGLLYSMIGIVTDSEMAL
jgi:hypothetical protein